LDRGGAASLDNDFTAMAFIIQQYFTVPRPWGANASRKENRAFRQRIPEDGSGSALTLFLRNLIIYSREKNLVEITSMGEGHGIFPNSIGSL
jgi:hypothetical protein